MRILRKYRLAAGFAILAMACVVGAYFTRSAAPDRPAAKQAQTANVPPVDERLMQTAKRVAAFADTREEQDLSREALRLADHELDQAFASALREATASAPPVSGPFKALAAQIAELKARIATDEARIAKLAKDEASGQLELAKAQLELDKDEFDDAQEDLAKQGGDKHAKLQRLVQEHEAGQHATVSQPQIVASASITTLSRQIGRWLALSERSRQIDEAQAEASGRQAVLEREHNALEKVIHKEPPGAVETDDEEDTEALVDRLKHLSDQVKTLAELDKRSQDTQQLAEVYKRWGAVVDVSRRAVLHDLLLGLAGVLAIVLAVLLIDSGVRRSFSRQADRKRLHHLRVAATIAIQLIGALFILVIVFGVPNQTSTMIGLATAGLTVVLKDFIVAFFGWFALMGPNGIRVGDWVEIEGVSGEVIEVGVLKTVLLETTGGASTGHPTGRRVSFVNKFAIENHYFNFSTAGQWLWDELRVTLPVTSDAYHLAMQIRERVERETDTDSSAAERDWERVTQQYGSRPFSAKPAVDLRPSGNGLDVIVRYVTHAPQRYEVKSRLFKAIVDLVHKPAA